MEIVPLMLIACGVSILFLTFFLSVVIWEIMRTTKHTADLLTIISKNLYAIAQTVKRWETKENPQG